MKNICTLVSLFSLFVSCTMTEKTGIDRVALLERNNPVVTSSDTLASLSVGNGDFAFTVDATGLQTFPVEYKNGIPLGTLSTWGWHAFANPENYTFEETLKDYDFGRDRNEVYSIQYKEAGRNQDASNWFRKNPHRLHLGCVGFDIKKSNGEKAGLDDIQNIKQTLDLRDGRIKSTFTVDSRRVNVSVVCDSARSLIAANVESKMFTDRNLSVALKFPYPTGGHCDDACDWNSDQLHKSEIVSQEIGRAHV